MSLQIIVEYLGGIATVSGLVQMIAPLPTCIEYLKRRSVGEMSGAPYVSAFLCVTLWFLYGYLISDAAITTVNLIGSFLQFGYVTTFYICCIQKHVVRNQMIGALSVIGITLFYLHHEVDYFVAVHRLGVLSCFFTVLFFAAPLVNLLHVLRVKSTESLPKLLILTSFLVSCQWLLYGYLINDYFLVIPNSLGCLLSLFQLILCAIYPFKVVDKLMPL